MPSVLHGWRDIKLSKSSTERQILCGKGMRQSLALMQMDTPSDMPARTRFGKFRGLRSWRTSAWDPKENLPREYARVFAFQAPTRAQRRCVLTVLRSVLPDALFPIPFIFRTLPKQPLFLMQGQRVMCM